MSFDADERSVSGSMPREFVEIAHGTTTYRIATGQRDITYNGLKFTAIPSARAEWKIDQAIAVVVMEISLPSNHAYAQRFLAMGSPPRQTLVTVRRMQLTSGEVQQIWIGYVVSVSFDKHEAKLSVPGRTQQALQINIPTMLVDTSCTHVLYDQGCQVDRAANTITATATVVDGRMVNVSSMSGHSDQWARGGELIHSLSGERMTISDQTGVAITMQAPIVELKTGDAVQIAAGCPHDLTGCTSFSNVVNYGGLPQRPTSDIYLPNGFGIREQT